MSLEEDLVKLFETHGVDVARAGANKHVRPGWLGIDCPFCGSQGKYHMGVNVHYLNAHCWGCGGRPLYELVKALDRGIPWAAVRDLKERRGVTSRKFDNATKGGKYKPPVGLTDILSARHRQMLLDRGIDCDAPDFDRLWGLRSIDYTGGQYKFRMFIPITLGFETVSYTTRSSHGGLRYLSARPEDEKVPHKRLLFGEDHVRDTILVFEGPLDVVAIGPGSTATFGTEFTPAQVARISRYPKRYICYDNEPHAQRQANELANQLRVLPGKTWVCRLERAKDPGSAGDKERAQLRKLIGQ